MGQLIHSSYIRAAILIGIPLASLIMLPEFSMDPINVPKAFVLHIVGVLGLAFLISNFKTLWAKRFRTVSIIGVVFILFLFSTLLFSGAPKIQQIFGAGGRATGLLSYLALVILLLCAMLISNVSNVKLFAFAILGVGGLNVFYGLIQASGGDPVKWSNPYSPVIGFLGNPNFSSSMIGLSCVVATALVLQFRVGKLTIVSLVGYELLALYVILKTQSIQGFVVFGLTTGLMVLIALYKSEKVKQIWVAIYALLATTVGVTALFGMVNIGPLSAYLYKISVRQRGYYWNAGVEMLKANPVFGVGLDSFGDWYWSVRSAPAALNSLDANTNSAHNVYLDIASNGGFPLLLAYLALNGLVLFRGIKHLKDSPKFDPYFSAIFVGWIGYQAQSFISINQLGLAVWGWLFGGLVLGYSFIESAPASQGKGFKRTAKKGNLQALAIPSLVSIVGISIVSPPFMADHEFITALKSRNSEQVLAATQKFPKSNSRNLTAAQTYQNSQMNEQAIAIAEDNVKVNPRDFNSWRMIAALSPADSDKAKNAIENMKKLNPRDDRIK
jgi:O-antigen ligase